MILKVAYLEKLDFNMEKPFGKFTVVDLTLMHSNLRDKFFVFYFLFSNATNKSFPKHP
jgi:hypothetical protein